MMPLLLSFYDSINHLTLGLEDVKHFGMHIILI